MTKEIESRVEPMADSVDSPTAAPVAPSSTVPHSPLPWAVTGNFAHESEHGEPWNAIRVGGGYAFDMMSPPAMGDATHYANAEFIVRACNSHDDLLAALKTIQGNASLHESYFANNTWRIAEDAIAKAEGR